MGFFGSVCQQTLWCPGYFSADFCHLHTVVIHVTALAFNGCVKWCYSHNSKGQYAKPCVFFSANCKGMMNSICLLGTEFGFKFSVLRVRGCHIYVDWLFMAFQWMEKMSAFVILFFDFSGLIAGILKNPQNFFAATFLSSLQVLICLCVFNSFFFWLLALTLWEHDRHLIHLDCVEF